MVAHVVLTSHAWTVNTSCCLSWWNYGECTVMLPQLNSQQQYVAATCTSVHYLWNTCCLNASITNAFWAKLRHLKCCDREAWSRKSNPCGACGAQIIMPLCHGQLLQFLKWKPCLGRDVCCALTVLLAARCIWLGVWLQLAIAAPATTQQQPQRPCSWCCQSLVEPGSGSSSGQPAAAQGAGCGCSSTIHFPFA